MERDNNCIYHQDVPAPSSLEAIPPAIVAKPIIPTGINNPSSVVGDGVILSGLEGWGVRTACGMSALVSLRNYLRPFFMLDIYTDRRNNRIREEIVDVQRQLDNAASQYVPLRSSLFNLMLFIAL